MLGPYQMMGDVVSFVSGHYRPLPYCVHPRSSFLRIITEQSSVHQGKGKHAVHRAFLRKKFENCEEEKNNSHLSPVKSWFFLCFLCFFCFFFFFFFFSSSSTSSYCCYFCDLNLCFLYPRRCLEEVWSHVYQVHTYLEPLLYPPISWLMNVHLMKDLSD